MGRNTGGPNRTQGKAGLIAGTEFRACEECGRKVFVPAISSWKRCGVCRRVKA